MTRMKNKIKKSLLLMLAISLLLGSLSCFSGCMIGAPKTEEIYDRVVELIEASYAVNTVFLGAGLPTHERDSAYADFMHMYYHFEHTGYEIVSDHARYLSVDEIKHAAEQVYSKGYLEDVLYPNAFDGYAIEDGSGGAEIANARYLEDSDWIYHAQASENYLTGGMRIYDYSTMRVVVPSGKNAITVEIDSYLPNDPANILNDSIRLVKQDDGLWYLDSFTG